MKKRDLNSLKSKGLQDIRKKLNELEKEKVDKTIELKMSKVKNLHVVSQIKKSIAQIKTIAKLKELSDKALKAEKDKEK